MRKERLDVLLVDKGLFETREKARSAIMTGHVYVNDQKADKPGNKYDVESNVEFRGEKMPFVSRGGYKLHKAVTAFGISLEGKTCLDIGASTGGFTDVMLQGGAKKVYAVDVGYGQFAWTLRTDERVVCLERLNFRYVTEKEIPEKIDFAATDVSFISIMKIIPPALNLMTEQGEMVALIKPQFEAGREKVEKKGVVRDRKVHEEVIMRIVDFIRTTGCHIYGLEYSPIKGPEGNVEFLVYFGKVDRGTELDITKTVADIIEAAHSL